MCVIEILVDPGDEIKQITVLDSMGKEVGELRRLHEPVTENGVTFRYAIRMEPKEGLGYVLRARFKGEERRHASFRPTYLVRRFETATPEK